MELDTSTTMMILFIILLVASIWKIYAFLPNKALEDDDTTEASQEELLSLVLSVIKKSEGDITPVQLCQRVQDDAAFDKKHFWRFNLNKLNQLLLHYYAQHSQIQSIEDIRNHEEETLTT